MANISSYLSFLFVSCIAAAISIKVQVHKLVMENDAWKTEPFDETYTLTLENKNDVAELETKVDILLKAHNEKRDSDVLNLFLAFDPSHGGIPEKDVSPDTELLQWGNPPKVFVKMATEVKFTVDGNPTERSVYVTANETWASIVFLHIVEELRIEKGDITEMRINDKNGKPVKFGRVFITTRGLKLWVKVKVKSGKMVNITVKFLSGKNLQFDKLGSSTTIEEIKRKIQDKEGIPGEGHRLIFQGKELKNSTTLEECNIQDNATFTLVQKLPVKVYRKL